MPLTSTAARRPDRGHPGAAMRVRRPAGRLFAERRRDPGPVEHRYLSDLLDAAGEGPGAAALAGARSNDNTYTRMTAELLGDLAEPLPPLDRMVLAYALPDPAVRELAGCGIADLCAGDPDVFSVSGQGAGAPFTALRILAAGHDEGVPADGGCLVFDQRTGPLTRLWPGAVAGADSVVLLHTTTAGGRPLRFLHDAPAPDPAAALAGVARSFPADHLFLGPGLAAAVDGSRTGTGVAVAAGGYRPGPGLAHAADASRAGTGEVHPVADLLPCTGLWHAAARYWDHPGPLLLAQTDPVSGRLYAAGFGAGDGPGR
ncbi:hypothetical protein E6P78_28270 [Streptomyces sp. A0958]|uniref:hypothetical protein n=1 Tax=Streptomyces sp. A0958 TaxID=2563101 RepID=UPI00109E9EDB|nr:hypothetical protein [Streptomyces sp. A0958]THA59947.1 hypothetical protein E6P78_28270 [Streptomyces sp. A0958]